MRVSLPMAEFVTWVGVAFAAGTAVRPVVRFARWLVRLTIRRHRSESIPAAGDGPVDPFVPFR